MKCLTIVSLVAVIATAGCLSNKSAKNEKVQPEAKAGEVKPAPEKPVEEWVAKPEMIFGAALGTKIDAEMKAAGVKADLPDRDSMAEVYHLACSAFRDPNFKFKPIGKLCPRHGFYPCQIWVNRQTRDIEQIFASPIEGAKDEDREKMGWELCKRFQPSFGKAKIGRAGKNVIWLFEFKDSKGFQCRAVLRTEKSKRDGLWSYHIMVFRVIKYVTQARKEEPKKPIAPFKTFKQCLDKVAIIKAGIGNATGFVVRADGKTWLYTNEHIARGKETITAKTVNGPDLELGAMEIAQDRDLVRFELKGNPPAFELAANQPEINTELCVVGNSAGGGVLTELLGRFLGEGKTQIEVDAEFVPGNSGSPVFTRDLKVIGVATHVRKPSLGAEGGWASQDTRFVRVRRFAMRTDNVKWIPIDRKLYTNITTERTK